MDITCVHVLTGIHSKVIKVPSEVGSSVGATVLFPRVLYLDFLLLLGGLVVLHQPHIGLGKGQLGGEVLEGVGAPYLHQDLL